MSARRPGVVFLAAVCGCLLGGGITRAAASATSLRGADDAVFTPGVTPNDTSGAPVVAHEGWILSQEDSFLWYGTSQKRNVSSDSSWDWLSDGIALYVSSDLSSWKRRGTVLAADSIPQPVAARVLQGSNGPLRLERPKVLYSSARRYFVLLFHLDNIERSRGEVGFAVSVSPFGPFKFVDSSRQPSGVASWDISTAAGSDTTAWLAQARPGGSGVAISQLTSDYLDTTGVCARIPPAPATPHLGAALRLQQQHVNHHRPGLQPVWHLLARMSVGPLAAYVRLARAVWARSAGPAAAAAAVGAAGRRKPAVPAAAPCLFQSNDKWYMLAVDKPGWQPSKLLLYVNDGGSPCNESAWRQLPSPGAVDAVPAFVLPYTFQDSDKVLLILFGDRFAPDPGAASYVWFPLVPVASGSDALQLQSGLPSWRISDFRPPAS